MWAAVNAGLDAAFGAALAPLAGIEPFWQGVILSLPVGLLALLIYRVASDQAGITRSKDRIKGSLLELLLFRDDLRVILAAQGRALWYSAVYLRYALVPMAILIVPVVLLVIQLETRHAHRGLEAGETALVQVVLDETLRPTELQPDPDLTTDAGLSVETPALRLDAERRLIWRIRALQPGTHGLSLRLQGAEIGRQLVVMPPAAGRVVPTVYRGGDIRTLGSPGDAPLANDSSVASFSVGYPRKAGAFAGLSYVSWTLFGGSLLFGFVLRRPLGVDF